MTIKYINQKELELESLLKSLTKKGIVPQVVYRIFLNRSSGFYYFFSEKNCGLYSKAAYIQGRLLLYILFY